MNVVLVCHDGAKSQSSYHVLSIAEYLQARGHHCVVCIPPDANSDFSQYRATRVPTRDFEQAFSEGLPFPSGEPSIVHCWTPREKVRQFTEALCSRHGCPYVVHLEDNEREILNRELDGISYAALAALPADQQDAHIPNPAIRIHPAHHWKFLQAAVGCTVLIERLKELVPAGTPTRLFWPGFDDCFAEKAPGEKQELRRQLGIPAEQFVVLYSGAFHGINQDEITRMVTAMKVLVNRGMPLTFVKTGQNDLPDLLSQGVARGWIRDLGFLQRERMPDVYRMADALVQPGRCDAFNAYRFPSKLPEALFQGIPVILPRCNLGLVLADGVEALVTDDDSMERLIGKLVYLYRNPTERVRIGGNGRAFCIEHLSWRKAAMVIESFYEECLSAAVRPTPPPSAQAGESLSPAASAAGTSDRQPDLGEPIGPRDLFQLFLEEQSLRGKGSVLATGRLPQQADFSPVLQRAQRKLRKYKTLYHIQLLVILVLLWVLWRYA